MKCTDKFFRKAGALLVAAALAFGTTACSSDTVSGTPYDIQLTSETYGIVHTASTSESLLMSTGLCMPTEENIGTEQNSNVDAAAAAGAFNVTTGETVYAQNILEKMYPASTTKILTAITALKYGNLDDTFTVSDSINYLASGSSVAYLSVGDTLTLHDLLYALMLPSGNDAALVIAEGIAGSEEAFVELMNEEAASLGAAHSHFVTVHGLHDEDHYTTVYDMYLIANEALQHEELIEVMGTKSYSAVYTAADGSTVEKTWNNTCWYISGNASVPDGFTIVGAKTGTTDEAKNCLVLISKNEDDETIISIVYKGVNKSSVYADMTEILNTFAKTE